MRSKSATTFILLVQAALLFAACDSNDLGDAAGDSFEGFVSSGNVEIHYELTVPSGTGPFHVVVLGQGSGDIDANHSWNVEAAAEFLQLNYAVMRYDKRGTGQSSGEVVSVSTGNSNTTVRRLADDMDAVIKRLLEFDVVDPTWVGLYGTSQANWYMPVVAGDNPAIDFMIVNSGGVLPVGIQNRFEELTRVLGKPYDQAEDDLEAYDGPVGFDQRPILRQLGIPMLYLWGTDDSGLPFRSNTAEMSKLKSEGLDVLQTTFAGGTHGLQEIDFWDDIRTWLEGLDAIQ